MASTEELEINWNDGDMLCPHCNRYLWGIRVEVTADMIAYPNDYATGFIRKNGKDFELDQLDYMTPKMDNISKMRCPDCHGGLKLRQPPDWSK